MKPEELADELGANAAELEGFFSSRPGTDTAPRFAETLRQAASALRRVEKLEAALQMIIDTRPDDDGSEYHCGYSDAMIDAAGIARQALTGEA